MRKRGFTLIEVLIALVIFVVGALAVIRIFPPAFRIVQNSGYSTVATRLSDSVLAEMKGDGSTPEAVFDIKTDSTLVANNWGTVDLPLTSPQPLEAFWQDQDGAVVGTADANGSLPTGLSAGAYDSSALGHFRFIRGEKHDVRVDTVTDPNTHAVTRYPHILTNFPYDVNSGVRAYINLNISGVTIGGTDPNDGSLDFTHATYIDPVSGVKTAFHDSGNVDRPPTVIAIAGVPVSTRSIIPQGSGFVDCGTRYYVSYQWRFKSAANPHGNTIIDEPLSIPDNSSTAWSGSNPDAMRVLQGAIIHNETPPKDRAIIGGPVPVKIKINLGIDAASNVVNFPNYVVPITPNPFPAADRQQWAFLGYVPMFGNPLDPTPHVLPANLTVYVDYLVPDWRTIYDQSISDGSGNVSLPINFLDINSPPSPLGLLLDPASENVPQPIAGTVPTDTKGQVNYGASYSSKTIRTAFKGLDQWARQISPSAESYIPYVDVSGFTNVPNYRGVYSSTGGNPVTTSYAVSNIQTYMLPREPWREYYCTLGSNTIYFHANEAGKSVQVSFVDTTGKTSRNQLLTIDKAITEATLPVDFAPVRDAGNSSLGYVSKLTLPANASSILGISGAGIVARTAWLNGSHFEQSIVTSYR